MLKLIKIEFYKLRRRWLPWVSLLMLLAFILLVKIGPFSSYLQSKSMSSGSQPGVTIVQSSPSGVPVTITVSPGANPPGAVYVSGWQNQLVLPGAMDGVLGVALSFGAVLAVVFAAMVTGSEYNWGTLRQTLIKGVSRNRFLTAKFLTLALAVIAGVVLTVIAGLLISMATTQIVSGGINWGLMTVGYIGDLLANMGRILLILGAYVVLTILLSVLFRSSATGMALGLGVYFVDTILSSIAAGSSGFFKSLLHFGISYNAQQLSAPFAATLQDLIRPVWQSSGILLAWGVLFVAVAYYAVRRQDLTA
jgi:ABC-type transport system involved in multi-copper enzyme maturation permease subunit